MRLLVMGNPKDQAFWAETVPEAVMRACKRLGQEHKFDAVMVDAGQEFMTYGG